MSLHSKAALGDVHKILNWVVADAAALAALAPTEDDLYKAALQIDTGAVYILVDDSPTWSELGGSASNGLPSGGTTGQILVKNSGTDYDASWTAAGTTIAARVYRNTAQALVSGATTKVQLNAETFDVGGYFDSAVNYRYTPLVAGKYQVSWCITVQASSGTLAFLVADCYKNGANHSEGSYGTPIGTTSRCAGADIIDMNGTTDYLEMFATASGTSPSVVSSAKDNFFSVHRIA